MLLLGGAFEAGELLPERIDAGRDLQLRALLAPGDVGAGVGVGRRRGTLRVLAGRRDAHDIAGSGGGAGSVVLHRGGADLEARHSDTLLFEHGVGASLHVGARQHAADAAQLEGTLVGVGVALPGERVADVERLLVDEVGVGLVHTGLAI